MNVLATRRDYILVSIVGLLFGLLLPLTLRNLKLSPFAFTSETIAGLAIGFAIFANSALWTAALIGRRAPAFFEFSKFGAVGALGTTVDFGTLNALIALTGIAAGAGFALFKGAAFIAAAVNSYFWNKYWTFAMRGPATAGEFGTFLLVSGFGFLINVGIASLIVNMLARPEALSPERWANLGAFIAMLAALGWNFVGYKFIVFRRQSAGAAGDGKA